MASDLKMPVLAPLKLRPKHREGYHSKSQMNILISEQNIKQEMPSDTQIFAM